MAMKARQWPPRRQKALNRYSLFHVVLTYVKIHDGPKTMMRQSGGTFVPIVFGLSMR
jgi:hypothetical protein